MRGNVENKNNPVSIRFVDKTSDIRNVSESITSDVMLTYQKWPHWYHYQWCQASGADSLVSDLCFVIKLTCRGNALFFGWLLSLCYIINIWSYSRHLHRMLLRGCGPSEKVASEMAKFLMPSGAGPVLSRFDRYLLIGPRVPSTYQSKLTISIEAACV